MRRFVELAVTFRYVLLAFCAALTGFFAYVLVTQSRLYDDPNDWLPANSAIGNLNNYMQEKFGGGNLVTIQVSVENGDIFNAETLNKVKRITREVGLIWGVIPYALQSIADIKTKYMRATEEFLDVTPLLEQVPRTPEEMERLKWGVYHNPLIYGALVSPDVKSTIIQADFRTGLGLSKRKDLPITDPVSIYRAISDIIDKEKDANHVIQAAGTPIIIGWVNSEGLLYIALAFLAFVGGVTAVLWRAFRSFRGAFIAVALGLVASLWAFGVKALLHGPVLESASALIAPFIVVAAAACHHTQFLKRFFDEEYPKAGDARRAIVNTFTPLLFPLMGSLVTDVVAFVVMAFVPFKNVSELGVTATYGLLSIVFNVFFLQIPMLAVLHGSPREMAAVRARHVDRRKTRIVRLLEELVEDLVTRTRRGKVMVACVFGAFLLSLACIPFLDPGQDNTYAIHNFLTRSWKNNEIFQMEQNIKKHFEGVYPLTIRIDSGAVDGLKEPEVERAIEAYENFMLRQPGVKGALGLPDYVKMINQFYEGGDPRHNRLPEDPQAVGLELEYYQEGFPGSFDAVASVDFKEHALRVYTGDTSHGTVRAVVEAARHYAESTFNRGELSAEVGGGAVAIAYGFNENIGRWLILATLASFVSSFVVLIPIFRSIVGPALLLLPLALGTVIWLGIVFLCGIEINSFTTAGMAMAAGVGVDAELYLLGRFREEYAASGDFQAALKEGFVKVREALSYSYVGLIAGCWTLIPIPLYVGYLGFGMGLILLVCFLCSFVVSPFLWSVLQPKFLLPTVGREAEPDLTPIAREGGRRS